MPCLAANQLRSAPAQTGLLFRWDGCLHCTRGSGSGRHCSGSLPPSRCGPSFPCTGTARCRFLAAWPHPSTFGTQHAAALTGMRLKPVRVSSPKTGISDSVWNVSQAPPLRILDPVLVRRGVTTSRARLLDDRPAGFVEPASHLEEFFVALNLDAQVIYTGSISAPRDGEIDARIVEHPFRVVVFCDRWLGTEERTIETVAALWVCDRDMDMKTFHAAFLREDLFGAASTPHAFPLRQFSVR